MGQLRIIYSIKFAKRKGKIWTRRGGGDKTRGYEKVIEWEESRVGRKEEGMRER